MSFQELLIVGLLGLNFIISWVNCWSVGGIWLESKAVGGWIRLLAWCGAIQSAIGFSSVIGALVLYGLHVMGHLPPKVEDNAVSLWYLLVIVPALVTGTMITISSWMDAARDRSLLSMGVATYNTLAMARNAYDAWTLVPMVWRQVRTMFKSDTDDKDGVLMEFVLIVVSVALFSGVLLTAMLIGHYAGRHPLPKRDQQVTA